MADERDELRDALDSMRAGMLKKLAGLSDADARRSTVPSGTSLAGLIEHLTFVESLWFEEVVAGGSASRGRRSMEVDPAVSLMALRADYRAACEVSNAILAAVPHLDVQISKRGRALSVRSAVISVLGETARHAGHADIIREQIDGRTGR